MLLLWTVKWVLLGHRKGRAEHCIQSERRYLYYDLSDMLLQ
jgi:hypothetical protein